MFALLTIPCGRPRDEFRAPEPAAEYGIVIRPERRLHMEAPREGQDRKRGERTTRTGV